MENQNLVNKLLFQFTDLSKMLKQAEVSISIYYGEQSTYSIMFKEHITGVLNP